MYKILPLSIVFFLTLTFASFAQRIPTNPFCEKNTPHEMRECFALALKQSEKEMDNSIKDANRNIKVEWDDKSIEIENRLISSQAAWVEYRDALCARNYNSKARTHSSYESVEIAACKYQKTKERVAELRKLYLQKNSQE